MNNLNPEQILKRFSTHLRNAIAKALSLATSFEHLEVCPTHILLALIEETGSVAAEIIKKMNLDQGIINSIIADKPQAKREKTATISASVPDLNLKSKQALERAMLMRTKDNTIMLAQNTCYLA